MFKDIDKPENDRVFLRSFSALLGSVILEKDNQMTILTDSQRQQLFAWSIDYLKREKDYRGFVQNKGWAHSVAHGSDFLGAALNHHKFITQNSRTILQLISVIFENMKKPFVDDEEQRLAFALYQGINAGKISQNEFADFICTFDQERYQALDRNNLLSWYKLSSWLKLMQNWYFFFDNQTNIQDLLQKKITAYYAKSGFLPQ